MTSTGRHVGAVGVLAVVVMVLPSILWSHSLGALVWGWAPVMACLVVLVGRRDLTCVVPLVGLGAATAEFLEAAPWPVPAVQLPDLRLVCVALHLVAVAWVSWRSIAGRSYVLSAAGVLVVLMSFHETFTEGTEPLQVLASLRHAVAMWSLLWVAARRTPRVQGVLRPAALFVLLGAAALPWALRPGPTMRQLVMWIDAVALFLLITWGGQSEGWRRVAGLGLTVGVGVAALGLARIMSWWTVVGGWAAFGYRLKAGGLHENLTASVLAATIPLVVTRLRGTRRLILWFLLPTWIVVLLLTGSRGGWAAAAAGLMVTAVLWKRTRRWLVPLALCVAVVTATLVSPAGRTARRRLATIAEGLRGREEAWSATGRMILRRPLCGHGWGAGYARARYATSLASSKYLLSHAHNLPLELAYSYGLLGLTLAVWLWVAALRGAGERSQWAAAGAGTITAVAVHGVVAQPLVCPAVAVLFILGLCLASGDTVAWRRSRSNLAVLPAWLLLLWVGSAVPILVAVPGRSATSRRYLAPLDPEPWQEEATRSRAEGRPGEAVALLRQALRRKQEFPPLLADLASALWCVGRDVDALRVMRNAHRLDPQGIHGGEHLTELGYMILDQGPEAEARSVLEAAVRREPYGFRKHPWLTRAIEGGSIEACLPRRGVTDETVNGWLRDNGVCPGVRAAEFVEGSPPATRDDYLWIGSALHALRRLEEAASVLEAGLEGWPGDGALSFRLAEVYRDAKRWHDEASLCHTAGLFFREAEARMALGDWQGALEAADRDLARREYRLANDFWIRAQALWRLGSRDEAIRWGRVSLFCLFRPERAVQIADWLSADRRSREACATYRTVLKHVVRERKRRWGTWDWRYTDHVTRLADAFRRPTVARTCSVTGSGVITLVIRSRAAEGAEAVTLATLAARRAPDDPWLWVNRADAQARVGDTDGALRSLDHAGRSGSDPARLLEREGRFLLADGRASDALPAFGQGSVLEPRNGRWLIRMWDVLSQLGYDHGAVAALREAGLRERDWADPHILLAEWWAERGRVEESETEYVHAIRADPYSSWVRDSYGRNLLAWSRPRDALAQLRVAATLEPLGPKPPYRMAQAYLALGDTAAALDRLEHAISLDPSFEPADRLLADVRGG